LIDKDIYLSLRGWRGILGRPPLVVLLLVLGYQFPWVLLTLFIFLALFIFVTLILIFLTLFILPTLFILLMILILFLILLTLFILLILILILFLILILILLSLMEVVRTLFLKVLKKLLCKLLYLINIIILRRERQRMGIAIQWQIVHVCMPLVKVLPVQNIHWHHPVLPCSFYSPLPEH
jgi:hypothetical protein